MSNCVIITCNETGQKYTYQVTKFPCGELQVRLYDTKVFDKKLTLTARLRSSDDIMELMQVKACLDLWKPSEVNLVLGYLPYARQDRVCNIGECHSLKLFANLINSMEFNQVVLVDPHSTVAEPLFDKGVTLPKGVPLSMMGPELDKYDVFVAPDAGAAKEVEELARYYGKEFVQGYKKRDPETGNLSGFGYYGDVTCKSVLIVDDLCDGGGTFLGLAEELFYDMPEKVSLYVTHGCFTKGVELLTDTFSHVYTTNTYRNDYDENDKLTVLGVVV